MLQLVALARRRLLTGRQVAIPNPALSGRRHVPGRYFWCRLRVVSAVTMNSRLGGAAAYANGDQRDQNKAKANHCGYLRISDASTRRRRTFCRNVSQPIFTHVSIWHEEGCRYGCVSATKNG